MGWKDFFRKKQPPGPNPLADLTLSKLKLGYFLDWDLKTWEVTSCSYYDWGAGDRTNEWQLKTSDDTVYLEQEVDDDVYWCVSRKITFSDLGKDIKAHILAHEDPPEEIFFETVTYVLESSGGGRFYKDGTGSGSELIKWDYEDESGKNFITIEQWGENNFEASAGFEVEEYQFSNILPRDLEK